MWQLILLFVCAMVPADLHGRDKVQPDPAPVVQSCSVGELLQEPTPAFPPKAAEAAVEEINHQPEPKVEFLLEPAAEEELAKVPSLPTMQAMVFSTVGCAPCIRMHRELEEVLPKSGWTVGGGGDCMICFRDSGHEVYGITTFPTTVFLVGGREVDRAVGYLPPQDVADRLNAAFAKRMDATQSQAVSAIPIGTLHARDQVAQLLDAVRPILQDGGTITLTYSGTNIKLPLSDGVEVTAANKVTATWSMKGDALHLKLDPPPKIKVSGMPVSQSLSGVAVSVDSITAELPWFPDLKVRVR